MWLQLFSGGEHSVGTIRPPKIYFQWMEVPVLFFVCFKVR